MAGNIKGITVEYDANTVKLQTALNKIKSESMKVESDLKQVNKQLHFDPKNAELLAQRQQLLKQRIDGAKTSLTELKNVQNQLDSQNVSKTSAEYMKVRREIIAAESKIRTFNAQLAKANWQGVSNAGKSIKSVGDKLTHATRGARMFVAALGGIALYKGFQRLKSLDETSKQLEVLGYRGKQLKNVMDAVSGSVDGTRFMLQDMAKVASGALGSGVTSKYDLNDYLTRTADLAQLSGLSVEEMGAMMNKAYSKGKVQAQLMNQFNQRGIPIYKLLQEQLGVTADELQKMSKAGEISFDDLYKATERYSGLAQKMGTETLPGALTVLQQQFGLIGADFLSGVYEPLKDGVRGIVASIKELRASGTFKEWGQDLGDTVKYFVQYFKEGEASMTGLSERAQGLVTVLSPLIKTIGSLVQFLAQLPPQMQGLLVFMTLFGGPLLSGLGSAVSGFAALGANIQTLALNAQAGVGPLAGLSSGLGGLSGAMGLLLNPLTLGAAAFTAWALGVKKAYDEEHAFTQSFATFKSGADQQIATVKSQNGVLDIYAQKLQTLVGKEEKSAADKAKIKEYVNQLNSAIDGLNLKYNEEKGQLNMTADAIQKKIDKYREMALVKVYEDQIADAAKKSAEMQIKLADLVEERNSIQKKWNNTAEKSAVAEQGYKMRLGEVNRKIKDAKTAISQYDNEMDKSAAAVENLSSKTEKGMKKTTNAAKSESKKTVSEYVGGIDSGKGKASKAADELAEKAKHALDVDTSGLGRDFGSGFEGGIMSKVRSVATAAANMVKSAISAAKAAQDSGSPSKVMRTAGREYGQGYALGIGDEAKYVTASARHLVQNAIGAATVPANGMALQAEGHTGGIVNNWYVDGAQDPEAWATRAAAVLEMEMRS